LGEWDEGGRLKIVGRKKDLIVLSTGKKVSPSEVESLLASSPLIEQAMVVGDGQSHIAALIVPNPITLRREIKRQRLWVWSKRRAVTHPKVVELYRQEIARVLADLPASHQVRDFAILTRGFSADLGELTPKLSLRRSAIELAFAADMKRLYPSL
jgi:long-chain acyl-CoA synthetase